MNVHGDAAEQVVRMSLEGAEVAVRLTGVGAKHTALLMAAILKESGKTKGKARLTSMLKSGKELKVFTVQQKDLKTFAKEAKRYGVLYCVLRDSKNKDPLAAVDVIARADDASKIQRITERFKLATVATASVINEAEKDRLAPKKEELVKLETYQDIEKPIKKEENALDPTLAKTEKGDPLSEPSSKNADRLNGSIEGKKKPSVREKLAGYRKEIQEKKLIGTPEKDISKGDFDPFVVNKVKPVNKDKVR